LPAFRRNNARYSGEEVAVVDVAEQVMPVVGADGDEISAGLGVIITL
jgi:hypothetical protein